MLIESNNANARHYLSTFSIKLIVARNKPIFIGDKFNQGQAV